MSRAKHYAAPSVLVGMAFATFVSSGCAGTKTDASKDPLPPKIKVVTAEVTMAPLSRVLPLTGTLHGEREADLAAGTAGRILKVNVERGTLVKAGEVIAVVDTRSAQISAAEAQTSAALAREQGANAKRECARYETLLQKGGISQAEMDKLSDQCRTTELSSKAAELRAAQAGQTVSDGFIRAPFAGVVADKWVNVGEFLRADSRVATVVTLDKLRLELNVPEARVGLVKPDGLVSFTVPSQPGRMFSGRIKYLGAAIREATRDLTVEATVDNTEKLLSPGMFAEVGLALPDEPTAIVPKSAILEKGGISRLFAVEDGRAIQRVVSVSGKKDEAHVGVVRGVKLGDRVVASPPPNLENGAYVEL